jgi:voltage-gated potassium channel
VASTTRSATPGESARRRLPQAGAFVVAITLIGAAGYHTIEAWSWPDSFYMVFITMSTVGFQEVHDMTPMGRLWTVFIVIGGVGSLGYTAASVLELLLEGHIYGLRRRRRMDNQIANMRDHIIVCGYGRVGHQIAEDLTSAKRAFVLIEREDEAGDLAQSSYPHILGSAESESVLKSAGIDRARTLIAAVDGDTENVFVTLTARVLNPSIRIVARASDDDAVRKLKLVGAERVISPYSTSGRRMAHLALLPTASDVFELIADPVHELSVQVQRIEVQSGGKMAGSTISDLDLRRQSGALVVALSSADEMAWNPDPGRQLRAGDLLTILGSAEQCEKIHALNGSTES